MSRTIARAAGFEVEVPDGWDLEITGDVAPAGSAGTVTAGDTSPPAQPVVHLGSFALRPGRGDFGSVAVEAMGASDVLVCLVEYDPAEAGSPLFQAQGVPELAPEDFDPNQMQRPIKGQSGCQRFFQEAGRAFCLYVVLGSHAQRRALVPQVNDVLRTLTIQPR